jgi:hypothetical protein
VSGCLSRGVGFGGWGYLIIVMLIGDDEYYKIVD